MTHRPADLLARCHKAITGRLGQLPGRWRVPIWGPRPLMSLKYAVWSFLSGTLGILAIYWVTDLVGHPLLIGSFGASAVLLFGANDKYPNHWL